tara:strand:- start:45 stop:1298 length:1254 start_codon:yes stop_codon:yes gene_type:complete
MARFKVPYELKTAVTARLRQTGMKPRDAAKRYNEFVKWFKSHVRENKLTQKEYSQLADIFEDAGIQKRVKSKGQRRQSLNLSHIREHSPYSTSDEPGSGLNFLENWYLNQKRGNKKLLQDDVMNEAGLPKTWEELFYAWDLQTQGQISSLGKLEEINPDDIIALHRGDPVNKVFKRRERINQILEDAEEDSNTISFNQTEYADLITKSRGLNPNDTRNISLRDDAGWDLGQLGNYVRKDEFEIEADAFARQEERRTNPLSIRDAFINYDSEEGDLIDRDLQTLGDFKSAYDTHYDKAEQLELVEPDTPPKHQWITNPLEGLNQIPRNEDAISREANKPIRQLRNFSIKGIANAIIPESGNIVVEPILNRIGNIEDQRLGAEIRKQDKILNQAYTQAVKNTSYSPQFFEQLNLLFPDD